MPHFIAKRNNNSAPKALQQAESNITTQSILDSSKPHLQANPESNSRDSTKSPYLYKLQSLKYSAFQLIAMPYIHHNTTHICFIQEITRQDSLLLKGLKITRPTPVGILKELLQKLSVSYEVLSENLAITSPKQHVKSPFLLTPNELLAKLDSASKSQQLAQSKTTLQAQDKSSQLDFAHIDLEIGFGSGRHIINRAQNYPNTPIIGLEIHTPSIEQVLRQIELHNLQNLFIVCLDARILLEILPAQTLQHLYIHFPVPWNKSPNRRVLGQTSLKNALRALQIGGMLEFRTDDEQYFLDVLTLAEQTTNIHLTKTINTQKEVVSKYEARWRKQHKPIFNLVITKLPSKEWQTNNKNLKFTDLPQQIQNPAKYEFKFDENLVQSLLEKVFVPSLYTQKYIQKLITTLCAKKVFEQGFLHIRDIYQDCARQHTKRVVLLVSMGDFCHPCNRVIVLEKLELTDMQAADTKGIIPYQGFYLLDDPLPSIANIRAHNALIKGLEQL